MGLLLDANIIPIGKKMYPGNESEKPILRNIIQDMKNQNNISGKTIQIADRNYIGNKEEPHTNNRIIFILFGWTASLKVIFLIDFKEEVGTVKKRIKMILLLVWGSSLMPI